MPIKTPEPPAGGYAVLQEHRFGGTEHRSRLTVTSNAAPAFITRPHRVYFAGLDALLRGELLGAAQQVAWRYLLVAEDRALSSARLNAADLVLSEINNGPFAQATIDALREAEQLDEIQRDDYELRLLDAPSVYFVALWLHAETNDVIVPLAPAPSGLAANRAYSAGEVAAVLQTRAAAVAVT